MLSDHGAAMVAIFDLDEGRGEAVASSLRSGMFCKVDVSSEDSVQAGFHRVREACGRLDIMVNCAGIVGPNGLKTDEVDSKYFDKVYQGAAIIDAGYMLVSHTHPSVKKKRSGHTVNCSANYSPRSASLIWSNLQFGHKLEGFLSVLCWTIIND